MTLYYKFALATELLETSLFLSPRNIFLNVSGRK